MVREFWLGPPRTSKRFVLICVPVKNSMPGPTSNFTSQKSCLGLLPAKGSWKIDLELNTQRAEEATFRRRNRADVFWEGSQGSSGILSTELVCESNLVTALEKSRICDPPKKATPRPSEQEVVARWPLFRTGDWRGMGVECDGAGEAVRGEGERGVSKMEGDE